MSPRAREIKGVLCLAAALFFVLCLFSYSPRDPSFTHFAPAGAPVHNLAGSFGSYLADSLIRLCGLSVLLIPLVLGFCAYRFFRQESFRLRPVVIIAFLALFLVSAAVFALLIGTMPVSGVGLGAGGLLGDLIGASLSSFLNLPGALLVLAAVMLVSLIVLTDMSLVRLWVRALSWASRGVRLPATAVRLGRKHWRLRQEQRKGREPQQGEADEEKRAAPVAPQRQGQRRAELKRLPTGVFTLPPLALLDRHERRDTRLRKESLAANARTLERKLADFGIEVKVAEVRPGPVITMYEVEPAPGVKINRITNLADDLALGLKSSSIRIIAPLPGKAAIGIEIPNQEREPVFLRDVLDHEAFLTSRLRLPIALGADIVGAPVVADLIRMPHLLIAGTTGSGKSVALNAMICSILFKAPPDEVKFLMIDPKRLELSAYEGIPHLLHPVVVDPKKASQVLKWAVEEMERRYRVISEAGARGIDAYNEFVAGLQSGKAPPPALLEEEELEANSEEHTGGGAEGRRAPMAAHAKLPYIVIVIDELADLMMVAPRDVEDSLARLAQMSRAAGIHLMLATQRPSVDVITGVIKANFPTRISFQVSSKVDSRTILDQHGAEKLLGAGDMLFMPPGTSKLMRIHGAFVADGEIERIVTFVKQQARPVYDESIIHYQPAAADSERGSEQYDEKYDEAVELVTDLGQASISLVQRYLKIGYNRAARIIERMEAEGVIGPSDGVKPRRVLARKIPPS